VYTSTEYPNQYEISLHNEMSYSRASPDFIFFACITAPGERGETPIADCRNVLKRLPPHVVAEFERRRVMYQRNMFGRTSAYNSWAKAFETSDPKVVEQYCREQDIEFEWLPNDQLRTREIRDAVCRHPVTGERAWFNQVNLWHFSNSPMAASLAGMSQKGLPMNAFFGDGGELDMDMLAIVRQAYAQEKRLFQWQAGDFLMLDNRLVAHGRMPFAGPRKIVVAMGSSAQ
jgi:alpha-ketoglutarate-dependent taurine dioxygenase